MSCIASVAPALPRHRYAQQEMTHRFAELVTPDGRDQTLLRRFHAAAGVEHRSLALPLERGRAPRAVADHLDGGLKVLDAVQGALSLPACALKLARKSLRDTGNPSSSSVLHVLAATLDESHAGRHGVMLAMGPGFCAELVLLRWPDAAEDAA